MHIKITRPIEIEPKVNNKMTTIIMTYKLNNKIVLSVKSY